MHLSAFLTLTEATAAAFPELPSISEQAVLLQAMALADAGGNVSLEVWSAQSGIAFATLERFTKLFASFGLVYADKSSGGSVRLAVSVFSRLREAVESGFEQ